MDENSRIEDGSSQGDLPLAKRVLDGDRRAFESLVRRHERRVFRAGLAVLGNVEDAEEVMQGTFLKAFRHVAELEGDVA